jgi:hypothetical protein
MSEGEREEAAVAKMVMAAVVMETMVANDRDGSGGNNSDSGSDREGGGSNGNDRDSSGGNGNYRDGSGGNDNDGGSGSGIEWQSQRQCVKGDAGS